MHTYEVRPRKEHRDVDLVSDVLPSGCLWYDTPDNAIGYAMHCNRSHAAVIRVYDAAGRFIIRNLVSLRRCCNYLARLRR